MDIKEEGGRVEEVILESLLAGKPRAAGSHVSGSQEWELQWRGKWCFAFIHADFCITPFSTPGLSGRFASGPCSVLRKEMSKTSGTRPRMDLGREETGSVPADHRVHRPTPRIRKAKLNGPKSPTSRSVWPHFRRLTTIEEGKDTPVDFVRKSFKCADFLEFIEILEARAGIEPAHKGFADLSLTTWVPRLGRAVFSSALHIAVANPAGAGGRFGAGDEI